MDNRRVPYVPEAAFNNGSLRRNSHVAAVTHRQSATRNEVDGAAPPVLAKGVATPQIGTNITPNSGVPVAVPAVHVSNPHQQLHNDTPRIIRRRPVKWTKRCQYDLSTGCHRGIECFFGHLGDVYTDSPTVLQEFTSNGFNTKTLRRADLERAGGGVDVDQALKAVVPGSQRYPKHTTGTANQGENAVDDSKQSSRDLLLAGAMDANTHFTPPEHLWDEETLHPGVSLARAEYEGVQRFELPALPEVPVVQRPNNQEGSQYPSAPGYNYHEYDVGTPCHTGLVYGLAVGMVPFFGASTSPLESPGNLFRLNPTADLYYYGVDGVTYQYNAAFWAAQNRQYHMDQHTNNYMAAGGPHSQQFSGPTVDPSYQYLQSWINDLPTPTLPPEGYPHTHPQNAGAWPPAHQQHGYVSPVSQNGYDSRVPPSGQQQHQEQPIYAGSFHQHTGPTDAEAQQSYEDTFPKLTSKNGTGGQHRSGSK